MHGDIDQMSDVYQDDKPVGIEAMRYYIDLYKSGQITKEMYDSAMNQITKELVRDLFDDMV